MNRYEPHLPRARMGLGALAMAAIALITLVALPLKLESAGVDPHMLVAPKVALASDGRATAWPA